MGRMCCRGPEEAGRRRVDRAHESPIGCAGWQLGWRRRRCGAATARHSTRATRKFEWRFRGGAALGPMRYTLCKLASEWQRVGGVHAPSWKSRRQTPGQRPWRAESPLRRQDFGHAAPPGSRQVPQKPSPREKCCQKRPRSRMPCLSTVRRREMPAFLLFSPPSSP